MLARPRNHDWVRGTPTFGRTGITSFTWFRATNQLSAPTWKPSFDDSAVRVEAVRIRSATESWNSRSPVRRDMSLAQRLDLLEQVALADRLGDVVLRALAKAPDLVGFLVLCRADDHRNVLGLFLARDRASGLEAVEARHHDVHQDEIGHVAFRALDRRLAAINEKDLVSALLQHAFHEGALRRRIVHHHYLLDCH